MRDLAGKNVAVTGAQGFIGRHVCRVLQNRGAFIHPFEDRTILKNADATATYLADCNADYVIHLAGWNGGIEFNRKYPAQIFAINTLYGLNITQACAIAKVQKLLSVITSCSYPENIGTEPYLETSLHDGPPNDVVACHGYAKRNVEIAARMYKKQYGLNTVVVCPNTVYGPGDRTDPDRTKVMTALIKKFVDAKQANVAEVVCWGTGLPKREFIYVTDTAEMLVRALEKWEGDTSDITMNVSTGQEYTIKELSDIIAQKVGYTGNIVWDNSKPDGAMRKSLNITKMKKILGEYAFTPIEQGIEVTVKWYTNVMQ